MEVDILALSEALDKLTIKKDEKSRVSARTPLDRIDEFTTPLFPNTYGKPLIDRTNLPSVLERSPGIDKSRRKNYPPSKPTAAVSRYSSTISTSPLRGKTTHSSLAVAEASSSEVTLSSPEAGCGDPIDHLLGVLPTMNIIRCKTIEASGLGANTALVKPEMVKNGVSASLPFKSWVTNCFICPEPFAIIQIPSDGLQSGLGTIDLYESHDRDIQFSGDRSGGICLTLVFDTTTEFSSPIFCYVSVSVSRHPKKDFSTVVQKKGVSSELFTTVLPASVYGQFIYISIQPIGPPPRAFRVSAIALVSSTRTASDMDDSAGTLVPCAADTAYSSLKVQKESISEKGSADTRHGVYSNNLNTPSHSEANDLKGHTGAQSATISENGTVRNTLGRKLMRSPHGLVAGKRPSTLSSSQAGIRKPSIKRPGAHDVAPVQTGAKFGIASSLVDTNNAAPHTHSDVVYDWFSDRVVDMGERRSSPLNSNSRHSCGSPVTSTPASLWQASAHLDRVQGMMFGMRKCTSFIVSVSKSVDIATEVLLTLSCLFHISIIVDESETYGSDGMIDMIASLTKELLTNGLSLELAFRVTNGFCCIVRSFDGSDPAGSGPKRCVLVLMNTPTRHVGDLLDQLLTIYTDADSGTTTPRSFRSSIPKFGALRSVLDFTASFQLLSPSLRKWANVQPIKYYGEATQRPLLLFLDERCRSLKVLLWEGLIIGPKQICTSSASSAPYVATVLRPHFALFFKWQHPQIGCPRVVLTDSYPLQSLVHLDMCFVPASFVSMVDVLHNVDGRLETHSRAKLLTVSDEPWQLLKEKVDEIGESVRASEGQHTADWYDELNRNYVALVELRRRLTVTFALHVLTASFRRRLGSIGVYAPQCLQTPPSKTPATTTTWTRDYSEFMSLDEDALMDTILHWRYAQPQTVVFFCDAANQYVNAIGTRNATQMVFSNTALGVFTSVPSMEEALGSVASTREPL